MNFLFVHQTFPGQYKHIVQRLAADPGNQVVFIARNPVPEIPGIRVFHYQPERPVHPGTHHYLHDMESSVLNGQAVARLVLSLREQGFRPDIMIGHNGWGDTLFLKEVWPEVPLLGYFEFWYSPTGADVNFDPEFPTHPDSAPRLRAKNAINLLGLDAADLGQVPTRWQRDQYPPRWHDMLQVVHEGIDTDHVRPDPNASGRFSTDGPLFRPGDELITYVARHLEPYRGIHSFLRSLPQILRHRPNAHVAIVGQPEGVSYGAALPHGLSYKNVLLHELSGQIDLSRVHFLGPVPYPEFLALLQLSAVHVYLSYPFVLSWSLLEAMSAGCAVVGSRTAPVQEAIEHGRTGLLVDFFNTVEIADAVEQLLADRPLARRLGTAAREHIVRNYDLETICLPRWMQLVNGLITASP